MHIDLTDHLRCPAPHPEAFLVLLPSRMDGRRVVTGELGCPVCGLVIELKEGVAAWEGAQPASDDTILTAPALAAFFGLSGPGGFIALTGPAASLAGELAPLVPGVRMALVNPPADMLDREETSVLRSPRFPLKKASMRGVALGGDDSDPEWLAAAARAVLPGLRLVGEGAMPPGIVALGRTGKVWVGTPGA